MTKALFNGSYIGRKNTGIGVVTASLAKHLTSQNISFLDPIDSSIENSISIPSNLSPDYGIKGHLRRLWWIEKELPMLLKRSGSDILLSPLPEAPLTNKRIRSVVIAHDLIPIRYPQLNYLLPFYLSYVPLVLHKAEKILCNSRATARELSQYFKIPNSKLIAINLGVEHEKFYPQHSERESFFLVLGRHNPHKNLARVIKAFSSLNYKNYKIVFIGPFDRRYTFKLQKLAAKLGLGNRCIWKDWVSDEERLVLLNTCRALVIASLWEGFGLPALEAMACGTPVIASNRGGLPEVVSNIGILVDPLCINSITQAMQQAIENISFQIRSAESGPIRSSRFNWNRTAKHIEKILEDMN